MKFKTLLFFIGFFTIGCRSNKEDTPTQSGLPKDTTANKKYVQINIKADYKMPTMGIDRFTSITDNPAAYLEDAKAIIRAKVILPPAMQKHDAALFDSTFARAFTLRGEQELYNRKDYISDRIYRQWAISFVQYENHVLQFFGEMTLLTYRNVVKEKDETGKPVTYFLTWADV